MSLIGTTLSSDAKVQVSLACLMLLLPWKMPTRLCHAGVHLDSAGDGAGTHIAPGQEQPGADLLSPQLYESAEPAKQDALDEGDALASDPPVGFDVSHPAGDLDE